MLEASAATIGANGGEIFYGRNLDLMFSDPTTPKGSRTPDIIVAPSFAHDDTNVIMLVAHPALPTRIVNSPVETAQVPPTILALLGLDPSRLIAVQQEGTQVLPGIQ